jgi:lysophospholipase L1-like esterase
MKAYRRYSTVGQMAVSAAVFAVLMLLLESGGLVDWADRLELGPERTVAVPITLGLQRVVGRMGAEQLRRNALVELARVGWSDDPAALAKVRATETPVAPVVSPSVPVALMPVAPMLVAPMLIAVPEVKPVPKEPGTPDVPKPPLRPLVGAPPLLSQLPEIAGVETGKLRTVALAGDSMMAVGLSSTLLREAPQYKDLELVRAFRSGTGLARPEVFDWKAEYPAMLGGTKPDVVLVAIGANDGQGFVADGITYPFGTPAWQAIYRARVTAYLAMLESGGATVVWLGLPPMKSDVYNARIALVNRIDYEVVSASPSAVWFSTAGLVGDAQGNFQDFGTVHGATVRLRQPDGIHLSDEGAVLVAEKLLPWLGRSRE